MKPLSLKKNPAPRRARWREALGRRLVWVTRERRDFADAPNDQFALVAVIGREHYDLEQRRYPVRAVSDLRRVLALELAGARDCLVYIGPFANEGREVTLHRLAADFPRAMPRALFWVPETLLLTGQARQGGVLAIERAGLKYFVAANGASLLAGGAIRDAGVFALAAGVALPGEPVALDAAALRAEFMPALARLPGSAWWRLRSPVALEQLRRFLWPAATFATLALLAYLALVSAYFATVEFLRARELAALGPEVTQLLRDQRALEALSVERAGLAQVVATAAPAWPVWEVVATVFRLKGAVYGLSVTGDLVTVRCTAAEATAVLEALRALRGFRDARFDMAVRQGGAGQEFVITLRRVPAAAGARP